MTEAHMTLGPQDREVLHRLLRQLSEACGFEQTLDRLFAKWRYFAREVERGYPSSICEYANDLGTRDILSRIDAELSVTGQAELTRALAPLDASFQAATVAISRPVQGTCDPQSWWWYRVPRNVSAELENDLIAEGVM